MESLKGKFAIVGLGLTEFGKVYGRSADDFATEAIKLAVEDAGLQKSDIDGLLMNAGITFALDPRFQNYVGLPNLSVLNLMQAILEREEPFFAREVGVFDDALDLLGRRRDLVQGGDGHDPEDRAELPEGEVHHRHGEGPPEDDGHRRVVDEADDPALACRHRKEDEGEAEEGADDR